MLPVAAIRSGHGSAGKGKKMANLVGQQLGQYEILGLIAHGGMAAVYRARQVNVDREVALKVIKQDITETGGFVKRFDREARTIAALSHPFIVKLFDYGRVGENVYLVMELLRGGSVSDLLRKGPLTPLAVAHILEQVSSALDYAHARGIVHRDLKPSNVLFDDLGNAYLSDFGISKILNQEADKLTDAGEHLTMPGIAMGTPAYMAPEQWRGEPVDLHVDIYALGIMLFEMLTTKLPFDAESAGGMLNAHLFQPTPRLDSVRPDLPATIQPIIDKAMAKDASERYSSAGEMYRRFIAALSSVEPPPEREAGVYPVSEFVPSFQPDPKSTVLEITGPQFSGITQQTPRKIPLVVLVAVAVTVMFGVVMIVLLSAGRGGSLPTTPVSAQTLQRAVAGIASPTSRLPTNLTPTSEGASPPHQAQTASSIPPATLQNSPASIGKSPTLTVTLSPTARATNTSVSSATPNATSIPPKNTPTLAAPAAPIVIGAVIVVPSITPIQTVTASPLPATTMPAATTTSTVLPSVTTEPTLPAASTVPAVVTTSAASATLIAPTDTLTASPSFTMALTATILLTDTPSMTGTATTFVLPRSATPPPEPTETASLTLVMLPTVPPVSQTSTPSTPSAVNIITGSARTDSKGIEQVLVMAGCFQMGSNLGKDQAAQPEEQPQHEVCLSRSYWIDAYEVTNAAFQQFVDDGGYGKREYWSDEGWQWKGSRTAPDDIKGNTDAKQPRVGVSWYEAEAYAHWRGARLPSEAEWEYAARGSSSLIYPWGDTWNSNNLNSDNKLRRSAPVGSYEAGKSWCGAYDMAGNAWEWTGDWFSDSYYQQKERDDPQGPVTGTERVLKGGSFNSNQYSSRSAYRFKGVPTARDAHVGFRVITPLAQAP